MRTSDGNSHTLILSASNRGRSRSLGLSRHIQQELESRGKAAFVIDLSEYGLPFHDPRDHHSPELSQSRRVREFAQLALGADSFVWSTPIYHGTFTGTLKNALDNLNIRIMSRKPVFLIANGGGRFGGAVFDHMRTMAVNLHSVAVNCQVLALAADLAEQAEGYVPVEEALLQRIARGVDELCDYVRLFSPAQVEV